MFVELIAFALGFISIFSPCVLPIIPVVFGASRMRIVDTIALFIGLIFSFLTLSFLSVFVVRLKILGYALLFFLSIYLLDERVELFLSRKISSLMFLSKVKLPPFIYGFFLTFFWLPCVTPFLGLAISSAAIAERAIEVSLSFTTGVASAILLLLLVGKKLNLGEKLNVRWENFRKALGIAVLFVAVYFLAMSF
ncbi:MAG: hypothetical protein ACK401_03600 [Archaeoglobaceae archaeon]